MAREPVFVGVEPVFAAHEQLFPLKGKNIGDGGVGFTCGQFGSLIKGRSLTKEN